MTTALGIAPDSTGKGVDPLTHRQVIKAHWENTGIICGLDVSGRSDLRYDVAQGVAVCSRGNADGYTEAYWGGGQSPAVGAGDPSNPRIDVIWLKANDISQGDSNNAVVSGVTQGTPSANPVAPSLPAGCTRLMSMRMPAGASSTQSATMVDTQDYAIPHGASLGVLARIAENKDLQASSNPAYTAPFLLGTFKMPTDRNLLLAVYACVSTAKKDGSKGVATVRFVIDGKLYTTRKIEYTDSWKTHECTCSLQLAKGSHTIGVAMFNEQGGGYVTHYGAKDNGDNYVGRVLVVKDEGVAR